MDVRAAYIVIKEKAGIVEGVAFHRNLTEAQKDVADFTGFSWDEVKRNGVLDSGEFSGTTIVAVEKLEKDSLLKERVLAEIPTKSFEDLYLVILRWRLLTEKVAFAYSQEEALRIAQDWCSQNKDSDDYEACVFKYDNASTFQKVTD